MKGTLRITSDGPTTRIELLIDGVWQDISGYCRSVEFAHNANDRNGPVARVTLIAPEPYIAAIADGEIVVVRPGE